MSRAPLICTVDDDEALCESLNGLLRSAGFAARTFLSPHAFLEWSKENLPDCLILDFAMPGMNGLELREALVERGFQRSDHLCDCGRYEEIWKQLDVVRSVCRVPQAA